MDIVNNFYIPNEENLKDENLYEILQENSLSDYNDFYSWSVQNSRDFWSYMVKRLRMKFSDGFNINENNIIDCNNPKYPYWFKGAKINLADSFFQHKSENCIAIINNSSATQKITKYSYKKLDELTNKFANFLKAHNIHKGDDLAICMPMNIEAVCAFIAAIKAGVRIISLADSFSHDEIKLRLEQIKKSKKYIVTQDFTGGSKKFPLYSKIKNCGEYFEKIFILKSLDEKIELSDKTEEFSLDSIENFSDEFDSVECDPEQVLNIIFSSSTSTGLSGSGEKPKPPKAIPWRLDSFIKSAVDGHIYMNLKRDKKLCWPTNIGWMMGSFDIAAAFLNSATLVLYDGNPTSRNFAKLVEEAEVNVLGVVPSIVSSWKKTKIAEKYNWSSIEKFASTGAPSSAESYEYLMKLPNSSNLTPVIEYMGGTEIGGGYLTCTTFKKLAASTFNTPTAGTELYFKDLEENVEGNIDNKKLKSAEIYITISNTKGKCPPMGISKDLLNFNHDEKYYPLKAFNRNNELLRHHGDVINILDKDLYSSSGRADDGININGIKTSSNDLESFIRQELPDNVEDVVIVGCRPEKGGEDLIVAFVTLVNDDIFDVEKYIKSFKRAIKLHNPQLAKIDDVICIREIPVTASNKIRRKYLKDIYESKYFETNLIKKV